MDLAFVSSSKYNVIISENYKIYKNNFVCSDIQKNEWYLYKNHKWISISKQKLSEMLLNSFCNLIITYLSTIFSNLENYIYSDLCNITFSYLANLSEIKLLLENMNNYVFKERVMHEHALVFFDNKFLSQLDSKSNLVGFNNGVYDLEKGFRNGLQSDYITKSVNYDWINYDDKDVDDSIFLEINKYFSEIQTEPSMTHYLKIFIAKIIHGESDFVLYTWLSSGSSGVTTFINLLKCLLGDYFAVISSNIFSNLYSYSYNTTHEFADLRGKKLVVTELLSDTQISLNVLRGIKYNGHIRVSPRTNYNPQFTLIASATNVLPFIKEYSDDEVFRHLRVIPFESKFIHTNDTLTNQNEFNKNEFLRNLSIDENFNRWVQPLMWMVITRYYPIFIKNLKKKKIRRSFNMYEPERIKLFTKDNISKYRVNNIIN